jgi:predicted membrane chloride channel (bestrophin family)
MMAALADNAVFTAHKQTMQRAKQLLGGTSYERLAMVQELSKDKIELVATLEAMARMLGLQMRSNPQPQWVALADSLQETLRRLRQNGNPRAQLVHLFMAY